jgi:S1-C subfamily serine protease
MQPVRLPGAIAQRLHLTNQGGVMVVDVDPDGPADRGGLMLGDILVAIGEQSISDTDDVLAQLGGDRIGQSLHLLAIRGGSLTDAIVTVGERP